MAKPKITTEPDEKPELEKPVYEPPTAEEWERTQAALHKANDEAKRYRLGLKEERDKIAEARKAAGEAPDPKAIRAELEAELAERYKAPAVKAAAKAALLGAGYIGTPSARVLAMIDAAECDVADDGEVTGLDAQVREIKKDFPALFSAKPPRPNADGAERGTGSGTRKLTSAERLAQGVLQG